LTFSIRDKTMMYTYDCGESVAGIGMPKNGISKFVWALFRKKKGAANCIRSLICGEAFRLDTTIVAWILMPG